MSPSTRAIVVEPARTRFPDTSVEAAMLLALGRELHITLSAATVTVDGATRFEIEGADAQGSTFVQLIGNAGEFKSAHRNRVTANLFKLAWIQQSLFPNARTALCITPSVAQAFAPSGWTTVAADNLGIGVVVCDHTTGELTWLLGPDQQGPATHSPAG